MNATSPDSDNSLSSEFLSRLEQSAYAALETYSNVHRGSGHNSMVSTHLFEQAREIILQDLGLNNKIYTVIFCTPRRLQALINQVKPGSYQILSSQDIGLSLGVRALVIHKKALPRGTPFQTGGGTTKLISRNWAIWANAPDKFEAGTPAIISIIVFAKALRLLQNSNKKVSPKAIREKITSDTILYRDELDLSSGRELLEKLRLTFIGRNVHVPIVKGESPFINLDNSASTPTFEPIWDAFRQSWQLPEEIQPEIIREVKSICATFLGAPLETYDVIFLSNTTEAINLAAENLGLQPEKGIEPVIISTLLEHSSNDLPWRMLPGHSVIRLSVDNEGMMDLDELERLLDTYNRQGAHGKKRIELVAISGASNVLGICNDIEEISRIVHRFGAHLLVDAAQLVAHRGVDLETAGIDYLAFSAHKVYAPFGCGVLVARKGLLNFNPTELNSIRLSGEENVGGIAALGKALVLLQRIGMEVIHKEEQSLLKQTLHRLSQIPGLSIYGIKDPDSPKFPRKIGVVVFSLKNMMPKQLANELAAKGGIGVRSGCHCAHIIIKHILNVGPSLEQFQRIIQTLFPRMRFPGLVRVSLGIANNVEDVNTLIRILDQIARQPRTLTSNKQATGRIEKFVLDSAIRVY